MEGAPREQIRERYGRRCGYCGVREEDAGATLTMDHHRPRIRGGGEDAENIVYCCPRCNEHKGSYWHETDPPHIRLLHPRRDDLTAHIREEKDGQLTGLTPEGVFFVQRLRLNRSPLVAYRIKPRAEQRLDDEVNALRRRVHELEQRIADLNTVVASTADEIERESM